ncbi:hypothetical protein T484DRAFT_1964596 [Baffinella frigidus]|nr:hypothetical protein T484DRAFT_1964596 [Cryptophyta sp. CCMP2293]
MFTDFAVPALCHRLSSGSAEMRSHACRLLGEMAFRHPDTCRAITSHVHHELVMSKLLRMMDSDERCDAGLVLNNCAAFCEQSCKRMVECPGLVEKFKAMATCNTSLALTAHQQLAASIAIGVFNCLSRSPALAQVLVEARVVEEALAPALCASGKSDQHEAMLALAAMTMANLTGNIAVVDQEREHLTNVAIATTVKILGFALDGKRWGGTNFAPYSIVYPLNNQAANPQNREQLVGCGLLPLLARLIDDWDPDGHNANETLLLLVTLTSHFTGALPWQERMRAGGVVGALEKVRGRSRGESVECSKKAEHLLDVLMQGQLAVCMGLHSRLGAESSLQCLDDNPAGII